MAEVENRDPPRIVDEYNRVLGVQIVVLVVVVVVVVVAAVVGAAVVAEVVVPIAVVGVVVVAQAAVYKRKASIMTVEWMSNIRGMLNFSKHETAIDYDHYSSFKHL